PPVLSYLSSEHVELQDRMGLLGRPVEKECADAESRVERWRAFLVELDLLDADVDPLTDPVAVTEALHSFLDGTPARMVGVALTDVVGERRMQNRPGSGTGYPNWRIPLTDGQGEPVLVDELLADPHMSARVRRTLAGSEGQNEGSERIRQRPRRIHQLPEFLRGRRCSSTGSSTTHVRSWPAATSVARAFRARSTPARPSIRRRRRAGAGDSLVM